VPLSNVQLSDAGCSGEVAMTEVNRELGTDLPPLQVKLALDGNLIAITLGGLDAKALASGGAADLAGSAEAREALTGAVTFGAWAAGIDADPSVFPLEPMLGKQAADGIKDLAAWLSGHVYEVAFFGSVTKERVSATLRMTTFGADPAAARDAYRAALARRRAGDKEGWKAGLAEVEKSWPGSLAGRRARLERAGTPLVGPGSAMILAGSFFFLVAKEDAPARPATGLDVEVVPATPPAPPPEVP
jgi:hypothetical protein